MEGQEAGKGRQEDLRKTTSMLREALGASEEEGGVDQVGGEVGGSTNRFWVGRDWGWMGFSTHFLLL